MKILSRNGSALVLTLMVVVVLLIVGSSFVLRAVNDWYTATREQRSAQAFALAEASAALAIAKIEGIVNTDMMAKIGDDTPSTVAKKAKNAVTNRDGLGFLVYYAKDGSTAQLTSAGIHPVTEPSFTVMSPGDYKYRIYITEKIDPYKVETDVWEFPYKYEIRAQGRIGKTLAKVSLFGDFTVRVEKDNFAKFALFTNNHQLPTGWDKRVWFTSNTHFSGPLHTNTQFRFSGYPTFDGEVTQQLQDAEFYTGGQQNAASWPPSDVPVFNEGYTRKDEQITLESSVQQQDLYEQARGDDGQTSPGVYVAHTGSSVTAGIYVRGDSGILLDTDVNGNAKYVITPAQGAAATVTVNRTANTTKVLSGGTEQTYNGTPDGVDGVGTIIYVDGSVTSLEGTVQKDTEITISAQTDIVITDHLVYEEYTPAVGTPGTPGYTPVNADGKNNLLGLVAWGGNVRIDEDAPPDVNIHGVIMARNGVFTADDYDTRAEAGAVNLLGGVITQFYGAFGTFDAEEGMVSGYARNFAYDERTKLGFAPPYFPSMKTFTGFTNDITDKITYRELNF